MLGDDGQVSLGDRVGALGRELEDVLGIPAHRKTVSSPASFIHHPVMY